MFQTFKQQTSTRPSRLALLSIVSALAGVSLPSMAADYYVSPTGKDTNAGTLAAPWKTIGNAAKKVVQGDNVYVRAGVYEEIVNLTRSGMSGRPITFRSYPGERAVIEGKNQKVSDEQGLVNLTDVSYVTFADFDVQNFTTTNKKFTPIGILVSGGGSTIVVQNNRVSGIKNVGPDNESKSTAKQRNALGVAVYGTNKSKPLDNVTIDGNELSNLVLGYSESLSVNGNVQNWFVTNNVIHDTNNIGIDAIGYEEKAEGRKKADDPNSDRARNGVIRGNLVYNVSTLKNPAYKERSAAGIYVDGGTGIVIENNKVHHTDYGIELASEHQNGTTSTITVRNNVIWNAAGAGITLGGSESGNGAAEDLKIVNNTLLWNNTDGNEGEIQLQYHVQNALFRNNIVYAGPSNTFLVDPSKTKYKLDIDYNLYFSDKGEASAKFNAGTQYNKFADWRGSGVDTNSRFANPLFLSTSTPDLRTDANSPALDNGQDLAADVVGTLDAANQTRRQGRAVDIGAYEQQPAKRR